MADVATARQDHFFHHEKRLGIVIHKDLRDLQPVRDAPVKNHREILFEHFGKPIQVVAAGALADDESVHHETLHHPEIFHLHFGILERIHHHHFDARLVEDFLDAADNFNRIIRPHFRDDNAHRPGPPGADGHRRRIGTVPHLLRHFHHPGPGGFADVFITRQRTRNRGYGKPQFRSDILDCNPFHHMLQKYTIFTSLQSFSANAQPFFHKNVLENNCELKPFTTFVCII